MPRTPAPIPPVDRKSLQAQALRLGLPATGTNQQLADLLRIAQAHPRTWTKEEFLQLTPHLCLHQDLRPGHEDRAAAIMQSGLSGGQVDSLAQLLSGGWTWAGGRLSGVSTYLFITSTLRFRGSGDPYLAPGNVPLCWFLPQPGTSKELVYECIHDTARIAADFWPAEDLQDADSSDPTPRG